MEFTAEQLEIIRQERNRRNREWWQRMSPEQRKQKRLEYSLNQAMRRKKEAAEDPAAAI